MRHKMIYSPKSSTKAKLHLLNCMFSSIFLDKKYMAIKECLTSVDLKIE
jgi:hypothetical protein